GTAAARSLDVGVHARLRRIPADRGLRRQVLRFRRRVRARLDLARDRRRARHAREALLLPPPRARDVHAAHGGPSARADRRLAAARRAAPDGGRRMPRGHGRLVLRRPAADRLRPARGKHLVLLSYPCEGGQAGSVAGGTSGAGSPGWVRRARAAQAGSHQFQRPIRTTIAGTSRARITVASKMIPAAKPMPNCLISVPGLVESTKKANISTSAALVTSLPVRASPSSTAFLVLFVSSYASRIRVSMKTS